MTNKASFLKNKGTNILSKNQNEFSEPNSDSNWISLTGHVVV